MTSPRDPFQLNEEAERANLAGDFDRAAQLFEEAAAYAYWPVGRVELLRKALDAKKHALAAVRAHA